MKEEKVIVIKRNAHRKIFVGLFAFLGLLWSLYRLWSSDDSRMILGGLLLACILLLLLLVFRQGKGDWLLELKSEGFWDYGLLAHEGIFVPWSAVSEVALRELAMQKRVVVFLKPDFEPDFEALKPFTRKLMETRRQQFGSPFVYNTQQMGCGYEQLLRWFRSFL